MFILRKVFNENKGEYNLSLGDAYNLISDQEGTHFEALKKEWGTDECYAFILYNGGSKVEPLYKKQGNYIMTPEGKTFANLTYR